MVSESIKNTVDKIHNDYSQIYANPDALPSQSFIEVPDYHSACIVMNVEGIPLNRLQPGSYRIGETEIQLSPEPLERYRHALTQFVNRL